MFDLICFVLPFLLRTGVLRRGESVQTKIKETPAATLLPTTTPHPTNPTHSTMATQIKGLGDIDQTYDGKLFPFSISKSPN